MTTKHLEQVEAFIEKAKKDPNLQAKLSSCALEKWGDKHTPLDIDHKKVIDIAREEGYEISLHDLIRAQCDQLSKFWMFEMENSFVGRRSLARIQMSTSIKPATGGCYGYY
jgi:hypothetical protein